MTLKTILLSCSIIMLLYTCSDSTDPFQEIVQTQIQRYPQMQIEDMYKLVHQAAMGNIHLGVDPQMLRNYLYSELDKIDSSDAEPLFEKISPDSLIRLNLRPFKAKGGDPEELFEAMTKTAQTFQPDGDKIMRYWKVVEGLAEEDSIPFDKSELDSFFNKMNSMNFPAVHHSKSYTETYSPAYRVILKQYLTEGL